MTLQEARDYYGGLASIDDARLQWNLDYAKRAVVLDGVSESHPDFDRLWMLRIGVSLPGSAVNDLQRVQSKAIDGVSVSYGQTQEDWFGSAMQRYREALDQVVGYCHRVA